MSTVSTPPETYRRCEEFVPPRRCRHPEGHEGEHQVDPTEPTWLGMAQEVRRG